jgi:sugar lactone lactonase YvrE
MRRRLALVLFVALSLVATLAAPALAHDTHAGRFPARINLPDGWQPEGITAGRGHVVYAGSLANGAIRRVNVRTGEQRTIVPGPGKPAVGIDYDFRNNRIWVAGGPTGEIRVYKASTGELLRTWTFPNTGFLNDIVVTRHAVYATDSGRKELKVVPLGRGGRLRSTTSGRTLALTGDFQQVANQFNANGIVAKDGWLIVVNTYTGKLFRVNPHTGATRRIDLGGASVSFGDGLELHGRTLYVVRNMLNAVAVFRLGKSLRSAERVGSVSSSGLDVPATAAFQSGFLWAVNARFNTPPTPQTTYWITRLPARP